MKVEEIKELLGRDAFIMPRGDFKWLFFRSKEILFDANNIPIRMNHWKDDKLITREVKITSDNPLDSILKFMRSDSGL